MQVFAKPFTVRKESGKWVLEEYPLYVPAPFGDRGRWYFKVAEKIIMEGLAAPSILYVDKGNVCEAIEVPLSIASKVLGIEVPDKIVEWVTYSVAPNRLGYGFQWYNPKWVMCGEPIALPLQLPVTAHELSMYVGKGYAYYVDWQFMGHT